MPKQISYQVCVNLLVYHYYGETKIYTIKNSFLEYLLATWFSLGSLFLGIWRFPGINTSGHAGSVFEAIRVNFTGGNEYTKYLTERNYSPKINFIWNNLSRQNREKLNRSDIDNLLELQGLYEINAETQFDDKNAQYLRSTFRKEGKIKVDKIAFINFLSALKSFESSIEEIEE